MIVLRLIPLLIILGSVWAAVNEPCIGSGGLPGVCISTSTCSADGGTSIVGACPRTPADIRCCTKASCGTDAGNEELLVGQTEFLESAASGNCRWKSDCAGSTTSNQCPGPAAFMCCSSPANGCGGYNQPPRFGQGGCEQIAIDGANSIVNQFPGRVREIGCKRSGASCNVPNPSDHCSGMANDIMCSDAGNDATMCGKDIAEWVMKNRGTLSLKYVIWGQRIWNTGDSEKEWEDWDDMEDRNSITANHWDHVHVSYKR